MNENIRRRKTMRTSNREDMEALERWIRPWLKKMGIPRHHYTNLSSDEKVLLHNLVCMRTSSSSAAQRRTLYQKLALGEGRLDRRKGVASVDPVTDEAIKEFFTPLILSERLPDLYKY
jgi:hypothetical protein